MRLKVDYQIMREEKKNSDPTNYEIKIKGRLDESWAEWFAPLTINHTEEGDTLLAGGLPDQAALQGVLVKLGNLNLALISVNPRLEDDDERS